MAKLLQGTKRSNPPIYNMEINKYQGADHEMLFHEILHLKEPPVDSLASYHFGTFEGEGGAGGQLENHPRPFLALQSKATWALLSFTTILLSNTVYLKRLNPLNVPFDALRRIRRKGLLSIVSQLFAIRSLFTCYGDFKGKNVKRQNFSSSSC